MQPIDALERIAGLAKSLTCAEFRVLFELTLRACREDRHTAKASTRELAHATGLARCNVQIALHSLVERNVLATDNGSASRSAAYRLAFLEVVVLNQPLVPGIVSMPPPQEKAAQVALFQGHPGIETMPPPGLAAMPPPDFSTAALKEDARARVDIDSEAVSKIDRLLKANPKNFDNALIQRFRDWLHGYMAKLGQEPHPHAPDDKLVAHFLACGEVYQLEKLLYDLMAERKAPSHSYGWFVTVAMQRLQGIAPEKVQQRRSEVRLVKKQKEPGPSPAEAIQQQVSDLVQEKRMHFHR